MKLWRVFPYDEDAADGEPYSVRSVAPGHKQTGGRFDLGSTSVLYLAELPAHGVAEILRRFTGSVLIPQLLYLNKRPLALVEVTVPEGIAASLVDLNSPAVLQHLGIQPDELALPESERARTQAIARRIYDAGAPGFRWWSAIHGGWHSTVVFVDRVPLAELEFGSPELLTTHHAAVKEAAKYLYLRAPRRTNKRP
ncbi:MAG TPA: RES family NAD+ phosphorylase [Longimicrobiaceae bacterium]|nr:RES family NAD+ phosphorylase [Longimicrobiaceae bacterium]